MNTSLELPQDKTTDRYTDDALTAGFSMKQLFAFNTSLLNINTLKMSPHDTVLFYDLLQYNNTQSRTKYCKITRSRDTRKRAQQLNGLTPIDCVPFQKATFVHVVLSLKCTCYKTLCLPITFYIFLGLGSLLPLLHNAMGLRMMFRFIRRNI